MLLIPPVVILAAGRGSRLATLTEDRPKALIELDGKPLILHIINGLTQIGLRRAIVVTGYRHEQLERALKGISALEVIPVFNRDYERGNGDSLLAAEPFIAERFLLAMGDHWVDPEIYRRAIQARGSALCVDFQFVACCHLDEATYVCVERSLVRRIGKDLREWNGVDTGVFALTPAIFAALKSLKGQSKLSLTEGLRALLASGEHLCALDVSGLSWTDIDTPDDLRRAEELLLPQITPR